MLGAAGADFSAGFDAGQGGAAAGAGGAAGTAGQSEACAVVLGGGAAVGVSGGVE